MREEVATFLKAARQHAPREHPLFLCALRTGMRLGERLGPFATRADAVAAERAVLATGLDRGVEDHAGRLSAPTRSLGQV
jgi:hypothetical protein